MPDARGLLNPRRWKFTWLYVRRMTPWDTGVTPPELRQVAEGSEALPPGRALDIGCGTGTNALYFAQLGWDVTGVDFARPAIRRAETRLRRAFATARAEERRPPRARFIQGDVARMREVGVSGQFDLLYDIGCLHGMQSALRQGYANEIASLAAPGALYMLYAFEPSDGGPIGVQEEEIATLFGATFDVERIEVGSDRGGRVSSWRWLRRRQTPQTGS